MCTVVILEIFDFFFLFEHSMRCHFTYLFFFVILCAARSPGNRHRLQAWIGTFVNEEPECASANTHAATGSRGCSVTSTPPALAAWTKCVKRTVSSAVSPALCADGLPAPEAA